MPCGPRLPTIDLDLLDPGSPAKLWSQDTALASTAEGARFAAWFDEHHVDARSPTDSTLLRYRPAGSTKSSTRLGDVPASGPCSPNASRSR